MAAAAWVSQAGDARIWKGKRTSSPSQLCVCFQEIVSLPAQYQSSYQAASVPGNPRRFQVSQDYGRQPVALDQDYITSDELVRNKQGEL